MIKLMNDKVEKKPGEFIRIWTCKIFTEMMSF